MRFVLRQKLTSLSSPEYADGTGGELVTPRSVSPPFSFPTASRASISAFDSQRPLTITPAIRELFAMFVSGLASSGEIGSLAGGDRSDRRLRAEVDPDVGGPTLQRLVRRQPGCHVAPSSRCTENPGTFQVCGASDPDANGTPPSCGP